MDNPQESEAEEETGGVDEKRQENQPLPMEILRARGQTADAAGPDAEPATEADQGPRSVGTGELHLFGCQRRWVQVGIHEMVSE